MLRFRNLIGLVCFIAIRNVLLLPIWTGIFGGLPELRKLHIDHNNLRQMSEVDIFDGCLASNLSWLDLSYNDLTQLLSNRSHTITNLTGHITYLNLAGNRLRIFVSTSTEGFEEEGALLSSFKYLRTLILSDNGFTIFNSLPLHNLTRLLTLDVSCNPIEKMHKEALIGLPRNLRDLDFSMCIKSTQPSPWFDDQTLPSLPPIKILRLNSGVYKKWIFQLMNFSLDTANTLEELYLDDNEISYLLNDTIPKMANLRVLSLNG